MLEVLAAIAGTAMVVIALADVFQSVIVPRSIGSRLRPSAMISRNVWPGWRDVALRFSDPERREDTLAMFAPTILVVFLAVWVTLLITGYGLIVWGLHAGVKPQPDLPSAIYFAGTSLLTIGYGDFVPVSGATRFVSLAAAASGLGTFAVVTTFLFSIFGAFQRREAFVVTLSERTGAPPSGLEFIVRHIKLDLVGDMSTVLREAQRWIAEVMETHLAYPVLTYFRSSHDDESWIGTLGAILDACALLITTTELDHRGQAQLTAKSGAHLVRDFTHFFNLGSSDEVGVEYEEFAVAYRTLRELGVPLRPLEDAWPDFAAKRATYAGALGTLANWWRIPPARWIGDRSRVRMHINAGTVLPNGDRR